MHFMTFFFHKHELAAQAADNVTTPILDRASITGSWQKWNGFPISDLIQ